MTPTLTTCPTICWHYLTRTCYQIALAYRRNRVVLRMASPSNLTGDWAWNVAAEPLQWLSLEWICHRKFFKYKTQWVRSSGIILLSWGIWEISCPTGPYTIQHKTVFAKVVGYITKIAPLTVNMKRSNAFTVPFEGQQTFTRNVKVRLRGSCVSQDSRS